jgi:prevent-host-death family protein
MRFTNVRALKMNTAELLQAVEEGEEIIITYHGKPRAMLIKIGEEEIELKESKRRQGILSKNHPFFKLIGKATDEAQDVSANKYRYIGLAAEKKR